jgi:hypothetical protein
MAGRTGVQQSLLVASICDVMLVVTFHLKIHSVLILRVQQALLHGLLGPEDEGTMTL